MMMQQQQSGPPSDNLFVGGLPQGLDESTVRQIFSGYGTIQQMRVMSGTGPSASALIRLASVEEATWVVQNLNGNIPQGLESAVQVRFATQKSKGDSKGAGGGPYGKGAGFGGMGGGMGGMMAMGFGGGYGKAGGGFSKGKGKGGPGMGAVIKQLKESGVLPGGKWTNDENAVFIRGLPADTTTQGLYSLFTPFGAIPANGVRAMTDQNTGLCTGIGFANFLDAAAAQTAIATLNGTTLPDGTSLQVQIKTPKGEGGKGGK